LLPLPALQGAHQVDNAAAAIAALARGGFPHLIKEDVLSRALRSARWPGRMQRIETGPAATLLPEGWELWLDGAHNDSGAEVLAAQARAWGGDKPLHLVTAMKGNKDPALFYAQLSSHVAGVRVLGNVPGAPLLPAPVLCDYLRGAGFHAPMTAENLESAVVSLTSQYPVPSRILITGSLYLAGAVLRDHG
jgi:dihydrofolate synthase / folylpolyglutamate synthase